jgi:hypothetical protein
LTVSEEMPLYSDTACRVQIAGAAVTQHRGMGGLKRREQLTLASAGKQGSS